LVGKNFETLRGEKGRRMLLPKLSKPSCVSLKSILSGKRENIMKEGEGVFFLSIVVVGRGGLESYEIK